MSSVFAVCVSLALSAARKPLIQVRQGKGAMHCATKFIRMHTHEHLYTHSYLHAPTLSFQNISILKLNLTLTLSENN